VRLRKGECAVDGSRQLRSLDGCSEVKRRYQKSEKKVCGLTFASYRQPQPPLTSKRETQTLFLEYPFLLATSMRPGRLENMCFKLTLAANKGAAGAMQEPDMRKRCS
jgi:hypothetical protein